LSFVIFTPYQILSSKENEIGGEINMHEADEKFIQNLVGKLETIRHIQEDNIKMFLK
jgi:hypothetical protein